MASDNLLEPLIKVKYVSGRSGEGQVKVRENSGEVQVNFQHF